MSRVYSCSAVQTLIDRYTERGGEVTIVNEGVLGYGELILHGPGLKTAIVREVYLNEWSSGHTIRLWYKTPKKYERFLILNGQEED